MPGIPFIKEFKFDYGTAMEVTPLIRRVVAHNPSPFTFKGTGTYIVGHGKVAVVDPGPDMAWATPSSSATARRFSRLCSSTPPPRHPERSRRNRHRPIALRPTRRGSLTAP